MTDLKILPKPRFIPRQSKGYCQCVSVFVVEQTRMLECQKCGRSIHPFDYLMKLSQKQSNIDLTIRILQGEKKRLEKAVEELKRIHRNVRARISSAKKRGIK